MAANRKSTGSKQVFDVTKPGKAAASATSRPVIVNHGPMLQDPMVSQSTTEGETKDAKTAKEEDTPVTVSSHKIIMPSAEMEASTSKPDKPETNTEADIKQNAEEPLRKDSEAEESAAKSTETEKDSTAKTEDTKETVDALTGSNKLQKDGPKEEELARQAQLETLIDSRKYAVPIGEMHHRSQRRFLTAFVTVLILALVGGYLAIDAGLVDVAIDLPFEIIKD